MNIPRMQGFLQAGAFATAVALGGAAVQAEEGGFVVMVEFAVQEETEAVLETVRGLLDDIVAHQEGFRGARLHQGEDGHGVVNAMRWDDRAAFDAFRAAHGAEVTEAVGRYGPQFRFYEVVHTVEGG